MDIQQQQPVIPAGDASCVDTREVKKVSFWVSQIFIVLATVLGVFLAANQGFKQAMAFENIRNDRNNYYLRLSLKNEIADNIALLRGYADKIKSGHLADRKTPFKPDTFVWDSMKNSPSTLETPPELLSESRNFYRSAEDIQRKVADNTYSHTHGIKLVNELVGHMESDVLPKFEDDLSGLRTRLGKAGINVD